MNEDKKKVFSEYSEVISQLKVLEEKKEKLGEAIFGEMTKLEVEQIKSDYGTFYFTSRKTWTYPEYVKEAEVLFKNKKKEAEEKGDAKFEEKKSLAYKPIKND